MRVFAVIAFMLLFIVGSVCLIQVFFPTVYLKLVVTCDVFGLNKTAKLEKQRLDNINLLPISNEKKNFLIEHRIFLGASETMVELALGNPLDKVPQESMQQKEKERWIYHFDNDINSTALEFHEGTLVTAFNVINR